MPIRKGPIAIISMFDYTIKCYDLMEAKCNYPNTLFSLLFLLIRGFKNINSYQYQNKELWHDW